jgi:hypothetical protein
MVDGVVDTLGSSNVPAEESKEFRPQEFVKTWSEWAVQNREQLIRTATRTGSGNTTMYSVPVGRKLIITAAWVSGRAVATAGRSVIFVTNKGFPGGVDKFTLIDAELAVNSNNSNSISLSQPIIVDAEDDIVLSTGATQTGFGGFVGWLE